MRIYYIINSFKSLFKDFILANNLVVKELEFDN